MKKSTAKEIIIALLLCLAIILVMAVLLYSYIPSNKVIPEQVAYTIPEDGKEILTNRLEEDSQVILTYEIQSSDINSAQKTHEYNPGKVNPFSAYVENEATTGNGTTGTTTSNGSESTTTTDTEKTTQESTKSSSSNSSTNEGTYFKNKGTK